jgi:thiol-disulfide isomerase/thioredoxin
MPMAKRVRKGGSFARERSRAPPPKLSFWDLHGRVVVYAFAIFVVIALVAYAVGSTGPDDGNGDGGGGDGNGDNPPTFTSAAPTFNLVTVEGEPIALDQYRGRVVVLDLFATWCGPCRTQMVELNKLRASYSEAEVVILSVDVDTSETEQQVKDFRDEYNAAWAFALDTDDLGGKYEVSSIPTLAIVTKDGKLAWRHAGATSVSELRERIDPLL